MPIRSGANDVIEIVRSFIVRSHLPWNPRIILNVRRVELIVIMMRHPHRFRHRRETEEYLPANLKEFLNGYDLSAASFASKQLFR